MLRYGGEVSHFYGTINDQLEPDSLMDGRMSKDKVVGTK